MANKEIISTLEKYHNDYPLKAGLLKEELRSRTAGSINQRLFNFIVSRLIQNGFLVQEKELLRLKDHKVTLASDQEKIRKEIEDIYLKGGLQPPYFKEIDDKISGDAGKDLLEVMVKEGILVKVKEDLYFHRNAIKDLETRLVDFLKKEGEINTQQFKDMTGASRKYTIPIIEFFDRSQVTVRVGDNRVLRKR
jgi:selenocysteine-specific elongation factor